MFTYSDNLSRQLYKRRIFVFKIRIWNRLKSSSYLLNVFGLFDKLNNKPLPICNLCFNAFILLSQLVSLTKTLLKICNIKPDTQPELQLKAPK